MSAFILNTTMSGGNLLSFLRHFKLLRYQNLPKNDLYDRLVRGLA
jgi:hypothetical protein